MPLFLLALSKPPTLNVLVNVTIGIGDVIQSEKALARGVSCGAISCFMTMVIQAPEDISKKLSDKMDLAYSNSMRIVRTESCWVMNEATVENYKDNGIKEYEFMAFLDSKTSKVCRKLDGKKFSIEQHQAGVNLPPLHPNCRSCIVPVVE